MSFNTGNIQNKKANFLQNTAFVNALSGAKVKSSADVLARLNEFAKNGVLDEAAIDALVARYGEAWNPKHYEIKAGAEGYAVADLQNAICGKFTKFTGNDNFEHKGCMDLKSAIEQEWPYKLDLDNAFINVGLTRHYLFDQPESVNEKGYVKDDWLGRP